MSSGQTFLLLRGLESKLASEGTSNGTDYPMYLNSCEQSQATDGDNTPQANAAGNEHLLFKDAMVVQFQS